MLAPVTVARDPYEVLGVPRDADADALKAAYREKALRYHPDRNPGDRQAEERFKELSEAYAVLRDPASRARYDRFGGQGPAGYRHDTSQVDWRDVFRDADIHVDWGSQGGVPHTGNAVFDALFGMMTGVLRGAGLVAGRTYELTAALTLGELHAGTNRVVAVPGPCVCPTCKGTGRLAPGAGVVRPLGPFEAGARTADATCPDCGGRGVRRGGAKLDVTVPPNTPVGARLRLAGAGGPGNPPGDVMVQIGWSKPADAQVRDFDVHAPLTVTPWEATRGGAAEYSGVAVTIPPGSAAGATVVAHGMGLPGPGGSRGDLRLTLATAWLEGAARAAGRWLRRLGVGGEAG